MRRRSLLGLAPLLLGGCSVLPNRPYLEKREWPLDMRRPKLLPPRSGARTLLVRTLRVAPGLEARGLQSVKADGSIHTAFYEEWAVPPAQAVEDDLRRWLEVSGLFAAVLAPGSRAVADLALEAELTSLLANPAQHSTHAALGLTLIDLHPSAARVLLQEPVVADAPLDSDHPEDLARSGQEAVARLMAAAEARIAAVIR